MKKLLALAAGPRHGVRPRRLRQRDHAETERRPPPPASSPAADPGTTESSEPAAEPITIKVGYMNNYGSLWSVLAADQMGYLEEHGHHPQPQLLR